jgi:hypothetical protein
MHINISSRTPQSKLYLAVAQVEDTRVQILLLLQDIRVQCQPQGLLPLKENPFLEPSPSAIKGAEGIVSLFI